MKTALMQGSLCHVFLDVVDDNNVIVRLIKFSNWT